MYMGMILFNLLSFPFSFKSAFAKKTIYFANMMLLLWDLIKIC